jgi:hypothetical protein
MTWPRTPHLKDLQALGRPPPPTVLRADLDVERSFDDAVAGCDYAFLVAAPVNLASGEDPEVRRHQTFRHRQKVQPIVSFLGCTFGTLAVSKAVVSPDESNSERADRACGPGNAERDEVVREDRDGEARGPDLVGGCSLHQAVAAGRRARPGRGVLVRRRVPQGREVADLGVLRVQGARGGGRVQVRAGARHQPRHRLPRHHRRRGAGHEHQHQRPELPLAPVR